MIFRQWHECLPWFDALAILDKRCFPDSPWLRSDWKRLFHSLELTVILTMIENLPVGYLAFSTLFPESELLRVGVDQQYRRQSMGKTLADQMIKLLLQQKTELLYLEVREDNSPAIALYHGLGFQITGKRKRYYKRPACDALLFSLHLNPE